MNENAFSSELQIPEYVTLNQKLKCKACSHYSCKYCGEKKYDSALKSKFECSKITGRFSVIKLIIECICLVAFSLLSLYNFTGFLFTAVKIIIVFIILCLLDFCSNLLIKFIFDKSEQIRRRKYDIKVQKIQEENEAIRKANLGMTEEVEKFLNNSNSLLDELSIIFAFVKSNLNSESKNEKRVIDKFKDILDELKTLNSKLSIDNIDSTYITTLYEIHLPKLLEYSKRFIEHFNSNILTSNEMSEFSNLLEVFRVKIANHAEYLKTKVEDDFIIKMKALNEDVIPDFDGSEVDTNE